MGKFVKIVFPLTEPTNNTSMDHHDLRTPDLDEYPTDSPSPATEWVAAEKIEIARLEKWRKRKGIWDDIILCITCLMLLLFGILAKAF